MGVAHFYTRTHSFRVRFFMSVINEYDDYIRPSMNARHEQGAGNNALMDMEPTIVGHYEVVDKELSMELL